MAKRLSEEPADDSANSPPMHGVHSFALRPWTELSDLKAEYWAQNEMSPSERLRVADSFRIFTLSVRSDWPDEAERNADLEAHLRVSRQLGTASRTHGR